MTQLDRRAAHRGARVGLAARIAGIGLFAGMSVFAAGPVGAAQLSFEEPVDFVSFAPATSATCGFPVFAHHWGIVTTRLITARDGTITREFDGSSGLHIEWFAPTTGQRYQFPVPGMLQTAYTGNTPGDPATAVLVGLQDGTPGAKQVGRAVIPAVFVGFGPFGIPDIDFAGPPASIVGSWTIDVAATIAARCTALA